MSSTLRLWADQSSVRLDREKPYLNLHVVIVWVRDQDRSLRFYMDQLGFILLVDQRFKSGDRWIEVSPPDGTANLALLAAKPDSEEYKLIGRSSQVVFITEDVHAVFQEWSQRGVRFHHPPQSYPAFERPENETFGGIFTQFEDVDGNSFGLTSFDAVRRGVEEHRREVARKLEAERRAAQELEIAKQVQARLFPQTCPTYRTIDYAGICIQAREVGGDYYDFLDLGQDRLGLLVGDISGKGIGGALLMANLQANVRSQVAVALDDPGGWLRSANQLFYANTADSAYATLFFAEYDETTRRLRYANCGHLSALLLRTDNSLERLSSTTTVLGLFREWDCSFEERLLVPDDVLALYTDGVIESFNEQGEEFGEDRLVEALRRYRTLGTPAILESLVDDIRCFSSGEQHDDITLIVAKCRNN